MSTAGATGGASTAGEEEMEDDAEMDDDSRSNVPMLAAGGTFIAGTADGTVTDARHRAKRQRAAVKVSEDVLNRQIQDYGLVSPERAKNFVWCFFKKYGSKKLKDQDDDLKLTHQSLCTICLADQPRRLQCTVKLVKDDSPSLLMDHMRIHHQDEYNAVERLFSVTGQVSSSHRVNLSSDNLTLLVFMHEALPLLRKIRAHRSEVAYNDPRGHGQFKATRPERKEKTGVALLPKTIVGQFVLKICTTLLNFE